MKNNYFERHHQIAYQKFLPIYITIKYACFSHILTCQHYLPLKFLPSHYTLIYTLIISRIKHIFTQPLYFLLELSIYIHCGSNYFTSCKAHQAEPNSQTHMTTISHILHSERQRPRDTVFQQSSSRHFSSLKVCSTSGASH